MLNFIDTHAHLGFQDYKRELDAIIQRSLNLGVTKIVAVSASVAESEEAIGVAGQYPDKVFAAAGIHPQCTDPENKDSIRKQIDKLEELIKNNKVVAVGECGLDYSEVIQGERKRSKEEQEALFLLQIGLANAYDLPLLIHLNKSHDYFLDNRVMVPEIRALKGIFHFYVGGKKRLKRFLDFEKFLFGVTGLVTYDEGLQQVVKEIPLERMVLETDCPFVAPLPHRGERNEPSYIPLIAQKVAEIKNISIEDIARVTSANASSLFGFK